MKGYFRKYWKIGSINVLIDVKRGYARNTLYLQKVNYLLQKNIKEVDKIKKLIRKKNLERKKLAKEISDKNTK